LKQVPELKRAVIEVFGGCNYACKMCPQTTGRGSDWTKMMPLGLFKDILDQLPGKPIINLEGSGEPTILENLSDYIHACADKGFKSYMFTNGSKFENTQMRKCIDAGLNFIRFSVIGYDRKTYQQWMNVDNFDKIKKNVFETKKYILSTDSDCIISSYHLLINDLNDVQKYRKNFIDKLGIIGYIWKMHNWSGNIDLEFKRKKTERKSCGRPFAPEITIRAGGPNGLHATVTPCCQTMGPPREELSVLGNLETSSLSDIWYGEKYDQLRHAHATKDFDSVEYCKDCDFLYDDNEVLVWSNDKTARPYHMLGTDFMLDEYREGI